jgi:protein-S-isoprenylcysteine O-methyltransferase Ste14
MGALSVKENKMEQKPDHAQVVVNPFVIYLGLAIAAVVIQQIIPLPFAAQTPARVLGVLLIALNFGFGLPAIRGMLKVKTSPNPRHPSTTLVSSGSYRFTRNPMYVGLTLVFAGALTFFQIAWGLLFVPLVVWLITIWVIIPEEEYLENKFGDDYLHYKSKVRRWI